MVRWKCCCWLCGSRLCDCLYLKLKDWAISGCGVHLMSCLGHCDQKSLELRMIVPQNLLGSATECCNTCLTLQRRAAAEAVEFSPHSHFVALNILCGNLGYHQVSVGDARVSMWMHRVYLWLWPRGGLTTWCVIVCDRLGEVWQKGRLLLILFP